MKIGSIVGVLPTGKMVYLSKAPMAASELYAKLDEVRNALGKVTIGKEEQQLAAVFTFDTNGRMKKNKF